MGFSMRIANVQTSRFDRVGWSGAAPYAMAPRAASFALDGSLSAPGGVSDCRRVLLAVQAADRQTFRTMLSTSLRSVISQQLIRRADSRGRVVACEVLINNPAIANLIREGKTPQIADVLERSALLGMQSLDNALRSLLDAHLITPQEAYRCAIHKQAFAALQEHAASA